MDLPSISVMIKHLSTGLIHIRLFFLHKKGNPFLRVDLLGLFQCYRHRSHLRRWSSKTLFFSSPLSRTFRLNFDTALIESCLPLPSRPLVYRQSRSHELFLRNISADSARLRQALKEAWQADDSYDRVPDERIEALMEGRYTRGEWNNKFWRLTEGWVELIGNKLELRP
jgi:hypothetical protein